VVPVRNEAGNLIPLTDEIVTAMTGRDYEIVFVDDGSDDSTPQELARLAAQFPFVRRMRHTLACGKSAALGTGVQAARGALVVMLDGDGQNNPAFLPSMLDTLEQGGARCGLVAGQRMGRKDTGFKKIQSRIANAVRGTLLRDGTRDSGCGLRAFRRDVFLRLPMFDGLHRFLPALVRREGYTIGYVDVVDRPRGFGQSKYGFWDRFWVGIFDLFGVWWLIRRRRRVPEALEVKQDAH
jgi:glycosyltransferase involved in cell wall biosynthesis